MSETKFTWAAPEGATVEYSLVVIDEIRQAVAVSVDLRRHQQPVGAGRPHVRGQVRDELQAAVARAGLVGEQRHGEQPVKVQHPRVVGVAGVE